MSDCFRAVSQCFTLSRRIALVKFVEALGAFLQFQQFLRTGISWHRAVTVGHLQSLGLLDHLGWMGGEMAAKTFA